MGISDTFKSGTAFVAGVAEKVAALVGDGSSGLLLLTVRPIFRGRETAVSLELSTGGERVATEDDPAQQPWDLPYSAFEADPSDGQASVYQIPRLRIPRELTTDLLYRLSLNKVPAGKPLWLKLARPYGVLGTAPWEKDLGAGLERPILRLPDYPERPVERSDVLESALIVDAEPDADIADVARRAKALVQAVLKGSSRTATRIHVFAASRCYGQLTDLTRDPRVVVHNPKSAKTSIEAFKEQKKENSPSLRSAAWVDWVVQSVGPRSLDAVHVIARAHWTESGAFIVSSASPSPEEKESALAAIDLDEFGLLVNRVGAWAVTFVPPSPACARDIAFVADHFAHLRPGAVLFNPGNDAEDLASLEAACKLLFSGKPSQAPALGNGFLHCHPGFVKGEQQPNTELLLNLLADHARLLAQRAPWGERIGSAIVNLLPGTRRVELSAPPAWVGAMQRFLESAVLAEVRRSGTDVFLSNLHPGSPRPGETLPSLSKQATDTLAAIQGVLTKFKN